MNNNIIQTVLIISLFGGFGYIALLLYFLKELKKLNTNHE